MMIHWSTNCFLSLVVLAGFALLCAASSLVASDDQSKFVYDTSEGVHYRFPTHACDLILDRSEAATSEAFIVILEPGEAPPLHKHDDTEQIFYILEGTGVLTIGKNGKNFPVKPKDLVRIPPKVYHKIKATGDQRVLYLAVDCFMGNHSTAEPTWDAHIRALCKEQGWDFNEVVDQR